MTFAPRYGSVLTKKREGQIPSPPLEALQKEGEDLDPFFPSLLSLPHPFHHWRDPSLLLSPKPILTMPLTFPPTSREPADSWDSASFSSS